MADGGSNRPARARGGWIAIVLGAGTILCILLAVGMSLYLLVLVYFPQLGASPANFQKLTAAALVALVGAGLTAMAAIYSATRQSVTAVRVALLSSETSRQLAMDNAALSKELADIKKSADEALARLKVGLDARHVAYLELYGAATVYFHAIRSGALLAWDANQVQAAETGMVAATRHLIHVADGMRNEWFDFWQRAQEICRAVYAEADPARRSEQVQALIAEKSQHGRSRLDFRQLHHRLENTAKSAVEVYTVG
ncbi:MAG: hypothetical protein EOS23_31330 [Mesorhizobium sp.]|nr:MAG: hypothetical protein EOS23_31330 [Mesorhizobium sp.]